MIRTRLMKTVAVATVAALAVAACGSDDGTADDTVEEPTPQETTPEETTADETSPDTVTVSTTFGGEITVPFQPERVVVLDFAALDTVDTLGFGDTVVGIPASQTPPPHLAAYADSAENVGNLFEIDFEAVNALAPDLILAGGRSQSLVPELAEIAPTVDITGEWGSEPFLESLRQNTTAIAQIYGAEDAAAEALAEIDAKIAAVAEQAADAGPGLVIMTSGGEVSAYGPDPAGRFDLVYNVFGIEPAVEQVAIDTHGDAISFEFLAQTNPDMLIVLDRDAAIGAEGESAEAILDNPLVASTSAAQNDKILYVETAKWYLSFGGLQSLNTMIDEVASLVG